MKITNLGILASALLLILGCNKSSNTSNNDYDFTYETIVTDTPVNLDQLNSSKDDYNSALPYPGARHGLYYSTNRGANNFNFIHKQMDISYHSADDVLNISYVAPMNTYDRYLDILGEINSEFDELGPYTFWGADSYDYFLYANNEAGNFDIKYVTSQKGDANNYNLNRSFTSLNSDYDDLYPSISADQKDIYFCSNREDDVFNIYTASFDENEINPDLNESVNSTAEINTVLSSDQHDKCPYVDQELMVFTSDRAGGYGGFDLYYSKNENGAWTEPINMGEAINSESDEYRPIIIPFYEFGQTMLIFSSNREGGKGGFDLYSVRVKL